MRSNTTRQARSDGHRTHVTVRRSTPRRTAPAVEALELRQLLAAAAPGLLDPLTVPKFVNAVPNPLANGFVYQPSVVNGTPTYGVGMYSIKGANLGLGPDPVTKLPRLTDVYGYGTSASTATYPGKTFQVQKDTPVQVTWSNNLPTTHLLPIDPTLLDPAQKYTPATNAFATGVPAVAHLHGGHTAAASDGLPLQWFTGGGTTAVTAKGAQFVSNVFNYPNDQEASTLWYHDHAMGVTRLNAYAGLAGFYLIRDQADTGKAANPLGLPVTDPSVGAAYEVPLAVQDKLFKANGQLHFPTAPTVDPATGAIVTPTGILPEMFGDTILVNGQAWPKLDVEPRPYRFRLLNGSDSRVFNFFLSSGKPIYQIGGDGGLLNAPVALQQLTLGPGERADVIINFAGQTGQVVLRNNAKTPFPAGATTDPRTTGQVMAFNVNRPLNTKVPATMPTKLRGTGAPVSAVPALTPTAGAPGATGVAPRQLGLFEIMDEYNRITPHLGTVAAGPLNFIDMATGLPTISLTAKNGNTEVWDVYNTTADAHPIHLHLVQFQVLGRQKFKASVDPMTGKFLTAPKLLNGLTAPPAQEKGWEDTVLMYPGEMTRIIARFATPSGTTAAGGDEYVWHCHILSHEEHDMMLAYAVTGSVPAGQSFRSQPQVTYNIAAAAKSTTATKSLFSTTAVAAQASALSAAPAVTTVDKKERPLASLFA